MLLILLTLVWTADGANTLSELRGLKTRESRMPVYSNDRLQLLLYCAECEQKGRLLETKEPVLDIIRRDADIDTIDTGPKTRNLYRLGSPFADVFRFWSGHLFSDGVVVTDKADIDQENQQAAGSDEVYFRSPLLDLDGIGFDADYRKRTIFIRKNVRIILRTNASDPLKHLQTGKLPGKYEFLRGSTDTLLIDMTKRVITLAGRVRVSEERGIIDCDRLQIFLPGEKDKKHRTPDEEWGIKGVSRIVCEGRVRVVRVGMKEMQQATADRMDYDLEKGRLRLTGTLRSMPTLRQGRNFLRGQVIDVYREQERMVVDRDCELVYTQSADGKKAQPVRATADRMDFDNRKNVGVLTGKVRITEPRFGGGFRTDRHARIRARRQEGTAEHPLFRRRASGPHPARRPSARICGRAGSGHDLPAGGRDADRRPADDHARPRQTFRRPHDDRSQARTAGGGTELSGRVHRRSQISGGHAAAESRRKARPDRGHRRPRRSGLRRRSAEIRR